MTTRKFNVLVTQTNEYEVEIDTSVWTEEELKNWSSVFTDAEEPEALAGIIASRVTARHSEVDYFEGFGRLKMFKQYENEKQPIKQDPELEYSKSIQITIIDEGSEPDFEVEEIQ